MTTDLFVWLGIIFCISQSAIFSGLNLAFFSLSRLQLEVEVQRGNAQATKILSMREDSNFLLCTILWGNVSINVLLTLLTDSVLSGIYSFLFSTIAITFLGEIFPQAYFSRNAFRVAAKLSPVIKVYQIVLFPVAKITALILDGWLGREGITYFREKELKAIISAHAESQDADVEHIEGVGAVNFLQIDGVSVLEEGELLDPNSIISLPSKMDLPDIPDRADEEAFKSFIHRVHCSGHKWVTLTDLENRPLLVLDADGFLRAEMLDEHNCDPYQFCHRPLIIEDVNATLGQALEQLRIRQSLHLHSDEVLDKDILLIWFNDMQRIITGADILGRLLKGVGDKNRSMEVSYEE